MHREWDGGKGSCFRKTQNPKRFYDNWDAIFIKEENKDDKEFSQTTNRR
jgi:hypothetical protein